MFKKNKTSLNYVDYTPSHNPKYKWDTKQADNNTTIVTIYIERNTLSDKFAQKYFKKPKVTKVDLDKFGSFVWLKINGEKTIFQIGQEIKTEYGESVEPLYERLATFIEILRKNQFITLEKPLQKQ
ncbi:PqqD family protein [Lachnobacterium bovis]|uniref:Coenzyme PQQ synthesis protein D (PqqD) n=1 Tax=Lachnobacterium bovis TaxID=140626 RepID=A0A1H9SB42_9FIRM|nr:PqqD family protein [Lachnobacterium bovis]SER82181.1 Coenzyme PQQ synthesis protein D (PqqD) [Lachnobacterium bovis]